MTNNNIRALALAATMMLAPAAASAADWWWVAGEPGGSEAWFVDTDSIAVQGGELSFHLLHVARGRMADVEQRRADCAGSVSGGRDDHAIQRFVCATPDERMSLGAMLGPVAPEVAANAIFGSPASAMAQR
jgi:hypothetical protein